MSEPRQFVRMFKPRFVPLVEQWLKLQTVRKRPKRMPRVGDRISLRTWTGIPYRSKQRILNEATISKVADIRINAMIWINGLMMMPTEIYEFAEADGFKDFIEMREWFEAEHGLPFDGILIVWERPCAKHETFISPVFEASKNQYEWRCKFCGKLIECKSALQMKGL